MKRDLQVLYISSKEMQRIPAEEEREMVGVSETGAHVHYLMQRDSRGATREPTRTAAIATGFLPRVDSRVAVASGGKTERGSLNVTRTRKKIPIPPGKGDEKLMRKRERERIIALAL